MGGGGLMQLVAYGAQDVFLTGSPQITFFKSLYRRYTNFSMESIEQTPQGSVALGQMFTTVISRNGDLMSRIYLQVKLPKSNKTETATDARWAYVKNLGHVLLEHATLEIGGQQIDKIYGRFDSIWHSLTCPSEKQRGMYYMAGLDTNSQTSDEPMELDYPVDMYIPIKFWFSKGNMGQALPLIALQYHEVRLQIKLAEAKELIRHYDNGAAKDPTAAVAGVTNTPEQSFKDAVASGSSFAKVYADFIFLDTEERRRFAQTSHEYLIEQLQFTGKTNAPKGAPKRVSLTFNHPCKEFIWAAYRPSSMSYTMWNPLYNGFISPESFPYGVASGDLGLGSMSGSTNNPVDSVTLRLNGHERFTSRPGSYFSLVQPYQHHTCIPENNWAGLYSFCISPEEHQPSGSLNMSRIDTAELNLVMKDTTTLSSESLANVYDSGTSTSKDYDLYVYATNYNVLRVLSGMGGLAFSN